MAIKFENPDDDLTGRSKQKEQPVSHLADKKNKKEKVKLSLLDRLRSKKQSRSYLVDKTGNNGKPKNGSPHRPPKRKQAESYLVDETGTMERERRLAEQEGHRKLAKVHAREHHEESMQETPEGELQNSIMQHPELNNQRFDGVDPNLNPEPPLNTEARREYDNQKREQEMEKQLRLGNMPKFTSTPRPQPG